MKISLIGMSGSGKSYWSKKLETKGFKRFCCDDLIEEKLGTELRSFGYRGIQDVARWMGQPFDPQYMSSSRKYLQYEKEVMDKIFANIKRSHYNDIVIDTTGSAIYTGQNTLGKLAQLTKVIYLDTPVSVKEEMYRLYLQDPKPVIWGKLFKKDKNGNNMKALEKYYPKLLAFRSQRYERIANVRLNYHKLRNSEFTIDTFMEAIE